FQDGYYFRTKPEFQFHNGFHPIWNLTDNDGEYFKKQGFNPVDLEDLKRLVESVELVELLGGIKSLKGLVDISNSPFALSHITREGVIYSMDEIKKAIADYEQIFGNTETLELETLRDCDTSPNCKKYER
ncbi:hypothetical protein F885_00315, partial [Acinetobacter higginsii]|uniref:hypothetical protein n=1 Tax=Acinetobacter higginsii TaxID=70347 RepID=UPI0002D02CB4